MKFLSTAILLLVSGAASAQPFMGDAEDGRHGGADDGFQWI